MKSFGEFEPGIELVIDGRQYWFRCMTCGALFLNRLEPKHRKSCSRRLGQLWVEFVEAL